MLLPYTQAGKDNTKFIHANFKARGKFNNLMILDVEIVNFKIFKGIYFDN